MVYGLGFELSLVVGIAAVIALVYGAEHVVDKLTGIAAYYEIPDVVIAMSVVSVGTSLPELVSHLTASVRILTHEGCPAVFTHAIGATGQVHDCAVDSAAVLGANIGSDVVQQTLVVGLVIAGFILIKVKRTVTFDQPRPAVFKEVVSAVRAAKFEFNEKFLKIDYLPMVGTTLMTMVLAWDGILSRADGMVLFGSFLAYMYFLYYTRDDRLSHEGEKSTNLRRDAFVAIAALVLVVISADILLEFTQMMVERYAVGGSLIGVVTLGIAAALPELFTALEGVRQKASGIALGTLIGSNITNPLLAIGLGSMLSTYWVPRPLVLWDLPMETFTAAMLLGYLLFVSDQELGWKGALYLIGLYVFYVVIRVTFFAVD